MLGPPPLPARLTEPLVATTAETGLYQTWEMTEFMETAQQLAAKVTTVWDRSMVAWDLAVMLELDPPKSPQRTQLARVDGQQAATDGDTAAAAAGGAAGAGAELGGLGPSGGLYRPPRTKAARGPTPTSPRWRSSSGCGPAAAPRMTPSAPCWAAGRGGGRCRSCSTHRSNALRRQAESVEALLSPDEYEAARSSTINAHYTSPEIAAADVDGRGASRVHQRPGPGAGMWARRVHGHRPAGPRCRDDRRRARPRDRADMRLAAPGRHGGGQPVREVPHRRLQPGRGQRPLRGRNPP